MNEHEEKNTTETTGDTESTTETVSTESVTEAVAEEITETTDVGTESAAEAVTETEAKETVVPEETTAPAAEAETASGEATTSESTPSPKEKIVGMLTCAAAWVKQRRYTITAAVLVVVAIIGMLYILEERGRIHTGMFDGVKKFASAYKAVAKVNGTSITEAELNTSVSQLSANAEAQGVDITSDETKQQIRSQALDMLINTELLKQEAAKRDIVITKEDVDARITELTEEVGGEEVLKERMMQFGIDKKTLQRDVKNELTIQKLIDAVSAEKGGAVTEDEIKDFYEQAGGEKAGLPKIEEVRDQIEAQIKQTKQQDVITSLIEELRKNATIDMM